MFAEIEFVQKYCKNWGYGTRASNIVADPRTITTVRDNIYKNEGPLSLGDASQKTPFFLEFTMFAEIEFVQKYCKNWGYGTRASNIVADPRTITTETD